MPTWHRKIENSISFLKKKYKKLVTRAISTGHLASYINKGVLEEAKRSHHVRREGLEVSNIINLFVQNIGCFYFYGFTDFAMHLGIHYI